MTVEIHKAGNPRIYIELRRTPVPGIPVCLSRQTARGFPTTKAALQKGCRGDIHDIPASALHVSIFTPNRVRNSYRSNNVSSFCTAARRYTDSAHPRCPVMLAPSSPRRGRRGERWYRVTDWAGVSRSTRFCPILPPPHALPEASEHRACRTISKPPAGMIASGRPLKSLQPTRAPPAPSLALGVASSSCSARTDTSPRPSLADRPAHPPCF
ncbi:hypothetical protein BD413DRAFT_49385 [Trametes elegans]|nr:hypothetical protein BD413DRAFT_49385 [Trametes elegans]